MNLIFSIISKNVKLFFYVGIFVKHFMAFFPERTVSTGTNTMKITRFDGM